MKQPGPGPDAAREAHAGLHDGLQARADLQRLLPGAAAAERRRGHGRDPRGPREPHRRRGRRRARGRRDHLRHRLPRRPTPFDVPRDLRRGRPSTWRSSGRARHREPTTGIDGRGLPQPVLPARPQHRARPQLDGVHDRVADPVRRAGLELLDTHGAAELDVTAGRPAGSTTEIQRKLTKGVWTQGGCKSWYLDSQGVNRTIWPGFTWRYWMRTKRVRAEDYVLTAACSMAAR